MFINTWRFITLILTALLMGTTFCHVLELPAKMDYPASLYMTLHRTLYVALYVAFGPPGPLAAAVLVFAHEIAARRLL